jgi:hypothetical protein
MINSVSRMEETFQIIDSRINLSIQIIRTENKIFLLFSINNHFFNSIDTQITPLYKIHYPSSFLLIYLLINMKFS